MSRYKTFRSWVAQSNGSLYPYLLTMAACFCALAASLSGQTSAEKEAQPMPVSAQTTAAVEQLVGNIMMHGQGYEYDRELADEIGARLSGSRSYLQAVNWSVAKFARLGLSNIHKEYVGMDTWEPGPVSAGRITFPTEHKLHLWSYGWSPSTPANGVRGGVVFLPVLSAGAIEKLQDQIKGKIVFYDQSSFERPFRLGSYLQAIHVLEASRPVGIIVPGEANATPSMGSLSANGSLSKEPVAQVGVEDISLLRRLVLRGPVRIEFALANVTHRKVRVPQVVADIPGREEPKEVVLVGAHLDSWNPGTGAQDNGTGVATLLDVARALKTLPGPPRRTVRFVLFGGEEQGMLGSVAYVRTHRDEMKRLDAVLITDTGAEPAKGWFIMGRKDEGIALGQMGPLLSGLSSDQISQDTSFLFQSDHAAFAVSGVPILMLWTETTKYFSLHHKASDTFDAISKAALLQGEATVAASVYGIADSSAAFAKHLDSGQVENMLENIGLLSDYRILHDAGLLP